MIRAILEDIIELAALAAFLAAIAVWSIYFGA
jgi:hypothetical protein